MMIAKISLHCILNVIVRLKLDQASLSTSELTWDCGKYVELVQSKSFYIQANGFCLNPLNPPLGFCY